MEPEMKSSPRIMKLGMPMTANVWRNARIDFGASCLFSLFNVVMNQFYVAFAIQQGASKLEVGLLTAAPAVGLLFSPFWATWIEKADNPRPFVIIPNAIGRLLLLLPALFAFPSVYVAAAIVFQLLMGIQAPAYASLISRMYPSDLRGRLMGYVRVAMGIIMIPLAYFVGSWSDAFGPSGPLIAASIAGMLSIGLFNKLKLPEQTEKAKTVVRKTGGRFPLQEQWKLVKENRTLAVFLAATTFSGFGNMFANPLYQIIQVNVLELSNVQIGYARVAYFSALLLTFLIAGWMLDRIDIKYTLMCGIAAYAIVPMLYGLWGSYSAVILGNAIQGIGEAIWDIGILAFVFRLAPGREAMVFGLHLMLFGVRGTLGPIISTSLSTSVSLTILLVVASVFGWIGTLMFVLGNRKKQLEC
ncbi:MFS transporter [Paenibacillus prosopidis]|uniref:Putative MFS family arabinose efflux permease n=1 Tax=Paenibacillus prosopidis TaxID=630520 RepID=A0A368VZA1_9BACL|nr:MFS transporter [Paenibacillus prosopidis]RCW47622.1 putative MFS family arabinose efflux permease [Paenibacillus prosopidis]